MMHTRALAGIRATPAIERTYDDPATGYRACVVIDSLACGTATGGIRIRPGLTPDEIRCAARTMTWKYRFIGLPNGGAKGGIEGAEDLPQEERARRLSWLGRVAAELIDTRIWGSGPDMGTDGALITGLLCSRNLLARRRQFPSRFRGSGFYTARSVVESAGAALALWGDTLLGKTAALEGFGSVGSNVARLISSRGARLVAISTSSGALYRLDGFHLEGLLGTPNPLGGDPRARLIPKEDLLRLEVALSALPLLQGGGAPSGERRLLSWARCAARSRVVPQRRRDFLRSRLMRTLPSILVPLSVQGDRARKCLVQP